MKHIEKYRSNFYKIYHGEKQNKVVIECTSTTDYL